MSFFVALFPLGQRCLPALQAHFQRCFSKNVFVFFGVIHTFKKRCCFVSLHNCGLKKNYSRRHLKTEPAIFNSPTLILHFNSVSPYPHRTPCNTDFQLNTSRSLFWKALQSTFGCKQQVYVSVNNSNSQRV